MQEALILNEKIIKFLNQKKYEDALIELNSQSDNFFKNKSDNYFLLAEIAGSYITLGSESHDLSSVEKGIAMFQDNRQLLLTAVTEDSIDYCLGNGFQATYDISIKGKENFFPTPENVKDSLFEAKQAYLKAFKKLDIENLNDYSIQVLTNLGNNLNDSGRIVEALQFFDIVLSHNQEFPQALVSKADGLVYMIRATNCQLTLSLFAEIYRLYNRAGQQNIVIEEIKRRIEIGKTNSAKFLLANGTNLDSIESEIVLNNQEYVNHPENIKFFLDNFLSLSEHGLYCKCNGAKIDDLSIGYTGFITTNKKLIQLELLHNRLKSEFSLARQLYFDFISSKQADNIHYENIVNGIINGINHERLRTSFRQCFGILDKIAEGICYLFDLEIKKSENIFFESFWNSNQSPSRWSKINTFKNIHLTALYSIACDLNKKNGEFGFYKIWRNRLEHGLFSLTSSDYKDKNWENQQFAEKTTEDDFEDKTKHLLQLTRSAIFSFVFCVRHELITTKENGSS